MGDEREVERLREKNDRQVVYGQAAVDVAEQVVALRGALQALVDATEPRDFTSLEEWFANERLLGTARARAVAVAVLTGETEK